MFHNVDRTNVHISSVQNIILVLVLVAGNFLFNIIANASFKVSADSSNFRTFLIWQVIGNLAGLVTVITLTWLLRYIPLHVAFPLTTGLAVIGIQVVASGFLFGERITTPQWWGTILILLGILLIGER